MVVEGVRLHQIDNVEFVRLSCFGVGNPEVVPLCVASGVVVWLQNQVVFIFINLDGSPQVAALKSRLKQQCVVFWALQHVEWSNFTLWRDSLAVIGRNINRVKNYSVH